MSYRESLVSAGARVLAFEHFGDWQGSWVALVEYQGQRGWVQGSFGSCDYCDAFQSEFDWDSDFACEDVQDRLAQFGRNYLDDLQTTGVYTGVVEKVNRKFVIVRTQTQSWRVPATMLEKV